MQTRQISLHKGGGKTETKMIIIKSFFYRIYSRQDTTLREYLTRVSGFAAKLKSTVETKEPKPKPKTQTLNHKT